MNKLDDFAESAPKTLKKYFKVNEKSAGEYEFMSWPKFPKLIKFHVRCWNIEGFGQLMTMQTKAMGIMKLVTASFTPNTGISVPFLLIDTMSMGKKRTVFVEYYDTRAEKSGCALLDKVYQEFNTKFEDYAEKLHWYVKERMGCSLIKCGSKDDEALLLNMVEESISAYAETASKAGRNPENLKGFGAFAERMIKEGNPSSSTLEKVLGKEGAEKFFREVIMPVK